MRLTLKRKVLGLVFAAAILPVVVMYALTWSFEQDVASKAGEELDTLAGESVVQTAKDIYALCQTADELIAHQASDDLTVAARLLAQAGGAELSNEVATWEATNQRTGEKRTFRVPRLLVGGRWLGQRVEPGQVVPVVDQTRDLIGAACSILQVVGENGDLLRVATSVETKDGRRALGTFIPALEADGSVNPLVAAAREGRPYRGMLRVADRLAIAACEPIRDRQGRVIAMIGVAEQPVAMNTLRRAIMETRVGRSGYVCVVGAKGSDYGRYVISRDGERDGEDISQTKDADGKVFIPAQLETAMRQPAGEPTLERYPWRNPGEEKPRTKIAAFVYFAPWEWVINVGAYQDDYYAARNAVYGSISGLLWKLIIAAVLLLAFVIGPLAVWLSNKATRPLGVTISVARKIAAGDLDQAREDLSTAAAGSSTPRRFQFLHDEDETSQLFQAFAQMNSGLGSLIGQVQRSGIQVTTSTTEIAASARQLESAVAEQAASTRQVTATTQDISKTAEELSHLMTEVGGQLSKTGSMAENGRSDLGKMEAAMRLLMKATASITSKLATINERANRISSVVTTINKISDQTNLLSLNAAIEAEKAGEYGKGFSVVAREISRLADQTAVATQDIEYVVREMQSSVATGVMEMDKFAEQVRKGVGEVAAIGDELTGVIDQVRNLGPEFETVEQCMQSQSHGAQQISEAMAQLSQSVEQTRDSLHEFKSATDQLNEAVQGLQGEVSRFRISAN